MTEANYAIATPCSGGFLAHLDQARSGCTVQNATNHTYCCSAAVARGLPGGNLLPAAGGSTTSTTGAATQTPAADDTGTPWITVAWDTFTNAVSGGGSSSGKTSQTQTSTTGKLESQVPGGQAAIDAGIQDGIAEMGAGESSAPPVSWMSQNWPIVAVGGVVLVGALMVGAYVMSKRESGTPRSNYPSEA